jgi:hydrogenase maturation protease
VTEPHPRILVLGLGNDILGDDAVGLLAARRLRAVLPETVDVVESGGGGLDLLDALEGYDQAVLLDAILTGKHPPGTILEFSVEDFKKDDAPSPHYAGLPTVLQIAENLDIHFPSRFQIVAVEVENPYEVFEGLSKLVEAAIPSVILRVRSIVADWVSGIPHRVETHTP